MFRTPQRGVLLSAAGLLAIALGALFLQAPDTVYGFNSWLTAAKTQYPAIAGSQLDGCALCHSSATDLSFNPYGTAFAGAGHSFSAIELLDSDGDGATNIAEIRALTFPGNAGSRPSVPTATPTRVPPTATPTRVPPTATPTTVPPTATPTRVPPLLTPTYCPANGNAYQGTADCDAHRCPPTATPTRVPRLLRPPASRRRLRPPGCPRPRRPREYPRPRLRPGLHRRLLPPPSVRRRPL